VSVALPVVDGITPVPPAPLSEVAPPTPALVALAPLDVAAAGAAELPPVSVVVVVLATESPLLVATAVLPASPMSMPWASLGSFEHARHERKKSADGRTKTAYLVAPSAAKRH